MTNKVSQEFLSALYEGNWFTRNAVKPLSEMTATHIENTIKHVRKLESEPFVTTDGVDWFAQEAFDNYLTAAQAELASREASKPKTELEILKEQVQALTVRIEALEKAMNHE